MQNYSEKPTALTVDERGRMLYKKCRVAKLDKTFRCILLKLKVHYRFHANSILRSLNSVHTSKPSSFQGGRNIMH
jgi:hypothetical protein